MPDTFLYFAYGSNMLTQRLRARCPSATSLGMAKAAGWQLAFTQKGGDASAKATLVPADGNTAHGVLFEIAATERAALDRAEDWPNSYRREDEFPVIFNGVERAVTTYIGKRTVENGVRPFGWYRALCLAGAHQNRLPHEVIETLAAHHCTIDPDPASSGRTKALAALENAGFDETGTKIPD
ncbi:MAG: gamma-glutamylcyclotransferase [Alphaproteobacteria bacterium]|nr:gamma-glutamylcyclotransferase [Alphaproteobacteria bacterium]